MELCDEHGSQDAYYFFPRQGADELIIATSYSKMIRYHVPIRETYTL